MTSYASDIIPELVSDEVAADGDFIVTAARPNTTATLANASFASGGARILAVATAGTSDNGKTTTITGTDVFDNTISEVITSTGSAESVAGAKYFKTVTSVVCSAQYAGNITVGSTASAAQAVGGGGRLRLKGLSVVSGGTAGIVNYYNGSPEDGTVLFKSRTIGTDNTTVDRTIPAEGVLFKDGMSAEYTVGTIDMMTFFYA
jgi:hypothetical protein|tara:strand:+ start:16 stop:624 length:609 start_codon:yes stop_codon:yes gene_type:complete